MKYDVIISTPDYSGIDYHELSDFFSKKYNVDKGSTAAIMFFMVNWTLDNIDNLKQIETQKG